MKKKKLPILAALIFAVLASLVLWSLSGRRALRLDSDLAGQLTYSVCPHTTSHITLTDKQRISEIAEQFNSLKLTLSDAAPGHLTGPDYRLRLFFDSGSTVELELYESEGAVCVRQRSGDKLFYTEISTLYELVDRTCTELLSGALE